MDVATRLEIQKLRKQFPLFCTSRERGGSGLLMANTLRHYFIEYIGRYLKFAGPYSLPTSFNIVESFLAHHNRFLVFDIRRERDHLLAVDDYFDWYTSSGMPEEPGVLADVMQEGVVYSFDLTNDVTSFRISTEQSSLAIVGASLIRHEHELTCLVVAGEQPPNPSDEEILKGDPTVRRPMKGRENLVPDPHYSLKDRYLESLPGFARVVLGTRFDLSGRFYDVRYVNLDLGRSYAVYTDDDAIFPPEIRHGDRETFRKRSLRELDRYRELFSATAALMSLPVMLVAEAGRVQETPFVTDLGADRDEKEVREAVSELGKDEVPFTRTVRCLVAERTKAATLDRSLEPPSLTFKSEGYWKPLPPGEVGEDKSGNPIVGKTWVQRIESWSVESPTSFLIRRQKVKPKGAEPGTVYVMRSPSHGIDIYKIGFTQRRAEERSRDLGAATGVPLPFAVVASWEVGDCSSVEREVHRRLGERRINPRREFFYASLSEIIATIESVVASEAVESDDS